MVVIDPEEAKGNQAIKHSCPYGSIFWNEQLYGLEITVSGYQPKSFGDISTKGQSVNLGDVPLEA
jgi:hypothetical protein